jgi:hypothetical protein
MKKRFSFLLILPVLYLYSLFFNENEKILVITKSSNLLQNIPDEDSLDALHMLLTNEVIRSLDEVDYV